MENVAPVSKVIVNVVDEYVVHLFHPIWRLSSNASSVVADQLDDVESSVIASCVSLSLKLKSGNSDKKQMLFQNLYHKDNLINPIALPSLQNNLMMSKAVSSPPVSLWALSWNLEIQILQQRYLFYQFMICIIKIIWSILWHCHHCRTTCVSLNLNNKSLV